MTKCRWTLIEHDDPRYVSSTHINCHTGLTGLIYLHLYYVHVLYIQTKYLQKQMTREKQLLILNKRRVIFVCRYSKVW